MAGANPNNPNGVEKGFQDALSKFKLRLSAREYTSFKFTTLKDLRQEILRIQAKQALKSECMNLTRVEAFVEGFRQFGEVVEVFLNTSEFVALVWGPMKFILQVRLTAGLNAGRAAKTKLPPLGVEHGEIADITPTFLGMSAGRLLTLTIRYMMLTIPSCY
jgi:hypothetical protein